MSNDQLPTANFQVNFGLGARQLEIGSWELVIGYSVDKPFQPFQLLQSLPQLPPNAVKLGYGLGDSLQL
jgi:hypothetical protein